MNNNVLCNVDKDINNDKDKHTNNNITIVDPVEISTWSNVKETGVSSTKN